MSAHRHRHRIAPCPERTASLLRLPIPTPIGKLTSHAPLAEAAALLLLLPRLRTSEAQTSQLVGPVMGVSLLAFAAVSVVVFALAVGAPW